MKNRINPYPSQPTSYDDTLSYIETLGKVVLKTNETVDVVNEAVEEIKETEESIKPFASHLTDYNNPHRVSKAQVGLGNVDNTADINKPISNPTKTYVDDKIAPITRTINEHGEQLFSITEELDSLELNLNKIVPSSASDVNKLITEEQVNDVIYIGNAVYTGFTKVAIPKIDLNKMLEIYNRSVANRSVVLNWDYNGLDLYIHPNEVGMYGEDIVVEISMYNDAYQVEYRAEDNTVHTTVNETSKDWEEIYTGTITGSAQPFKVSKDNDGKSFSLDQVWIEITVPEGAGTAPTTTVYYGYTGYVAYEMISQITSSTASGDRRGIACLVKMNNFRVPLARGYAVGANATWNSYGTFTTIARMLTTTPIRYLSCNANLPVGTVVRIYGVRS